MTRFECGIACRESAASRMRRSAPPMPRSGWRMIIVREDGAVGAEDMMGLIRLLEDRREWTVNKSSYKE